jgi:hypothetical protein
MQNRSQKRLDNQTIVWYYKAEENNMITILIPAWQAYIWLGVGIIYSVRTTLEIYNKIFGPKA